MAGAYPVLTRIMSENAQPTNGELDRMIVRIYRELELSGSAADNKDIRDTAAAIAAAALGLNASSFAK